LRTPNFRRPVINYYNPEIPYYDPRYPQFYYNNYPGYPGEPGGGGPGGPGGPGNSELAKVGPLPDFAPQPKIPAMVLYISCGEDAGPGRVYQVDDNGRVLGMVNLPYTATGLALHRTHGLVCALPRDGGRLMRIDETGKVATIMEKDPTLVHPVDVGVGAESDTIVVGDNIGHVLAATTTAGDKPKVYRKFDEQKWAEPDMSVAVTRDKHVIYGSNGPEGIFRYAGDNFSASQQPLLPGRGGVAADTNTLMWAATQNPNQVYVFEGEELVKKLRLPPNKAVYRQGLLSFAPAGKLVVATRPSDNPEGEVWLTEYETDKAKDGVRNLFPWSKERMVDFVVGPRMFWDRHSPDTYKSVY
jgi:hypothetical protein